MSNLSNKIETTTKAFLEAVNAKGGPQIYELSVEAAAASFLVHKSGRCQNNPWRLKIAPFPEGRQNRFPFESSGLRGTPGVCPL